MSNPEKNTCFVIRPFSPPYDERHDNIFAPAIERAGLSVHFADSPGVINITEEIENGIRNAQICFADISEDNPNVWYEVGFAFACGKKVAMVCNTDMRKVDKLPFDIRVKKVILYDCSVDSKSKPAAKLQEKITEHVREASKFTPSSVPQPHILDKHQVKEPSKNNPPSVPQPHILDKHQVKEPSKNNPPSAPQPPTEDNASIIHDGLTREDFKILYDIMMYNSQYGSPLPLFEIKSRHNSLEVDISIRNLTREGHIVFESSQMFVDGYKNTDKAQKLYESRRDLFNK